MKKYFWKLQCAACVVIMCLCLTVINLNADSPHLITTEDNSLLHPLPPYVMPLPPYVLECMEQKIQAKPGDVILCLGEPQQIFHKNVDAMGMWNVPDMHTAVLQQQDGSYLLWITGDIGKQGHGIGSVALIATKDFLTYENVYPNKQSDAEPVFWPSCRGDIQPPNCQQNYDANYVGANTVITASNSNDLLMFYEAGNRTLRGSQTKPGGWEYNVIALARSSDVGRTWTREGVVLSGPDIKPTSKETNSTHQPGISEPGAIVVGNYIYMYFQYIPNIVPDGPSTTIEPSVIQVARAPIAKDGKPKTWRKYYNGAWGEPGLRGKGSKIVDTGKNTGCTRPVQVWPAKSSYLNAYVLTFLCNEGWFFSTSTDLVTWAPIKNFLKMTMWIPHTQMDDNYVLVTPGKPGGEIGQTGYVLYASTPSRGTSGYPHELWIRPFTFDIIPAPQPPKCPSGADCPAIQQKGNVCGEWVDGKCIKEIMQ